MIWVESGGGPLVLIDEALLPRWSGFDDGEGDYDRACEASTDVVNVLPIEDAAKALILGDAPAGTAYIPALRAFVRCIYGQEGTDVPAVLRAMLDSARWERGPTLTVTGPLVLFDPAYPGREAVIEHFDRPDSEPTVHTRTENGLRIEITPGAYRVDSADLELDDSTCLRVHRLV